MDLGRYALKVTGFPLGKSRVFIDHPLAALTEVHEGPRRKAKMASVRISVD
jgi:hypothetical protein